MGILFEVGLVNIFTMIDGTYWHLEKNLPFMWILSFGSFANFKFCSSSLLRQGWQLSL